MRIYGLIPLALMLSFIFTGCAELPHQPALVIDVSDTTEMTAETVVDDGLEIPGPDLDRRDGACRVEVKLLGVYYGGDNIGHEWIIKSRVNNQPCVPSHVKLKHGQWNTLDITCIKGHTMNCFPHLFFFRVCAQQPDFPFPDKGCGSGMTGILCQQKLTGRRVIVPVSVVEVPYLFPFPRKVARLYFVYDVRTVCLTP